MMRWWESPVSSRLFAELIILPIWWLFDRLCPKSKNSWAFFVHPLKNSQFVENSRAIFESVKNDTTVVKYVFTRDVGVDLGIEGAVNTHVIDLQSLRGLLALARCGVYMLTNAIALDMSWRWNDGGFSIVKASLTRRIVVNLWHGIPIKKLFAIANPEQRKRADRVSYRRNERKFYQGLIASSDIDSYAMAAIFHPIKHDNIWITGLPRNDFLVRPDDFLPKYLLDEINYIKSLKKDKRLILYAPTYREADFDGAKCFQFTKQNVSELKKLLARHNAVLGFRMHYYRKESNLFNMEDYVDNEFILDVGHSCVREIASVLRESDVVITDYSSLYIDALYLDKPVISFAYDLESYKYRQNGLLYDMELVFPGPIVTSFPKLIKAIDFELSDGIQVTSQKYKACKKIFFNYFDDKSSLRVIDRVRKLQSGGKI